jgi:hypothetical protein
VIDSDNGSISTKDYITESGHIFVEASAVIDGKNYSEETMVSYCAAGGSTGS